MISKALNFHRIHAACVSLRLLLAFLAASSLALTNGFTASNTNAPDLFETSVHDPSTLIREDDTYWCFSTGPGLISRFSRDLIHWSDGPRVFTNQIPWIRQVVPRNRGHLWAPDIIFLKGRYLLYYSASSLGERTSAIALATNPTLNPADPRYAWTDQGIVVSTTETNNHNAIDPSIALDPSGRLWMAYGSYWSGIKLIELDPATGLRLSPQSPRHSLAWKESIEASCLYPRDNRFYLFVNWGKCCRGTNSTYEIRVGRSDKATGPYLDKEGKDLLRGGGSLFLVASGKRIGPGHAAILKENGKEFVSYHYYDATRSGKPTLEIAPLDWTSDGWPVTGKPLRE